MIDLSAILDGECLKVAVMVAIGISPLVYGFALRTQVKAAKDIIKEKNEEIERLQGLVDNYTQQLIDRNNNV